MQVHLLAIDPQESFVNPTGSLFVPGADADMDRLASLVDDVGARLTAIHVTLDNHHPVDISHPSWWVTDHGDPAKPITIMTYVEARDRFSGFCPIDGSTIEYQTRKPGLHPHSVAYIKALSASGRYGHTVWPEHCLIGSTGATVHPAFMEAINRWARKAMKTVNFVAKGTNPMTEHFSAVQAEVPQANDPSTQLNTNLITTLEAADVLLLSGEALSHCVANTATDIAQNFGDPKFVSKIHLIRDCASNVPGFDKLGDDFVTRLTAMGMKTVTAAEVRQMLRA